MTNTKKDLKQSLRIAKLDFQYHKKNMELAEQHIKIYQESLEDL